MILRGRLTALALAALLVLTLTVLPSRTRAQDQPMATVSIEGPTRVAPNTDDVQLNVNVKDASNFAGFQFILSMDSAFLQPISVDKTDMLGRTGRDVVCQDPTIDPAAVRFVCVTLRPEPAGVDGDGTIAVVHLKATNKGKSPVQLSHVKLVHPDGTDLPSRSVDSALEVSSGGGGGLPWWSFVLIAAGVVAVALIVVALVLRRRGGRGISGHDPGGLNTDLA